MSGMASSQRQAVESGAAPPKLERWQLGGECALARHSILHELP